MTIISIKKPKRTTLKPRVNGQNRNSSPKKTRLDIGGKKWLQYSISVWDDIRKSAEELKLKHPAMFPKMLCDRLVQMFSKKNDLILDPFAGTGSTLIAAQANNRNSIGVELSPKFISLYEDRLKQQDIFSIEHDVTARMISADSNDLLQYVEQNSVSQTITSPPYWDILNQKRTADGKKVRNYGASLTDLGNIASYEIFLKALSKVFKLVYATTKIGGYCCIILMDIRKKDRFFPFHIDTINFMIEIGFVLDDMIIWDRKHEYNNLRPLGYPHVFRVNKVHEYIFSFSATLMIRNESAIHTGWYGRHC